MLPDLSKLEVTGASNAGHFREARKERVSVHRAGDDFEGSMPCWVALTAPDASPATALQRASFALPCQLFYGTFKDGVCDTYKFPLHANSSHGLVLGDLINFDDAPTIELVADVDTTNPEEFKAEFQVWTAVLLQQSDPAQKIAECRLGMRGTYTTDGRRKPLTQPGVFMPKPGSQGEEVWKAARTALKQVPELKPILEKEDQEGVVAGYEYETALGMQVKTWLPCLQSDVIFYYVECLTDRTYPPMVGAYMLPEDPAIKTAKADDFPDAFPAFNARTQFEEHEKVCVHNEDAPLRDVKKVFLDGYLDGLRSCPAKNFMFKRALAHEEDKPGSSGHKRAASEFVRASRGGGGKRPRG